MNNNTQQESDLSVFEFSLARILYKQENIDKLAACLDAQIPGEEDKCYWFYFAKEMEEKPVYIQKLVNMSKHTEKSIGAILLMNSQHAKGSGNKAHKALLDIGCTEGYNCMTQLRRENKL